MIRDGLEIKKGEYSLVWLKDTPKYDKNVKLPMIGEIIIEALKILIVFMREENE